MSEERPPLPIREPQPPIIAHQEWEHLWRRSLALPGTPIQRCVCGETKDGWDE
jgi:hypothetical protein